jgi:hypothetical protein
MYVYAEAGAQNAQNSADADAKKKKRKETRKAKKNTICREHVCKYGSIVHKESIRA